MRRMAQTADGLREVDTIDFLATPADETALLDWYERWSSLPGMVMPALRRLEVRGEELIEVGVDPDDLGTASSIRA